MPTVDPIRDFLTLPAHEFSRAFVAGATGFPGSQSVIGVAPQSVATATIPSATEAPDTGSDTTADTSCAPVEENGDRKI